MVLHFDPLAFDIDHLYSFTRFSSLLKFRLKAVTNLNFIPLSTSKK
jgi:hypothetical protein